MNILIVGGGNMGYAILSGINAENPDIGIYLVEPNESLQTRAFDSGAKVLSGIKDLPESVDIEIVLFAVKPSILLTILPQYTYLAEHGVAFVSVAAGVQIKSMESILGQSIVVRCMPNMPAAIGAGVIVCCPNAHTDQSLMDILTRLLLPLGEVFWIGDEDQLDAVTAVSGSGPAYIFHFIEGLAEAAKAVGLPEALAMSLAIGTVAGAGKFAAQSKETATTLREQVASPGGTTAAGLSVLMANSGLASLLNETVKAAVKRGRQLR